MKQYAAYKNITTVILAVSLLLLISIFITAKPSPPKAYAASQIQHVFIIAMENRNWSEIKGAAPYITNTLLPMGAHAEQFYNPPNNHPSAPNYVWLEAGA